MELKEQEQESVHKIRAFILKNTDQELLKRLKCRRCRGTGLVATFNDEDGSVTFWDCKTYCDFCKGIGYLSPVEIDKNLYQCTVCNGEGLIKENIHSNYKKECKHCKGIGFLNWVENLFGRAEDDL